MKIGNLFLITIYLTSAKYLTTTKYSRLEFIYRVSISIRRKDINIIMRSLSKNLGVALVPIGTPRS